MKIKTCKLAMGSLAVLAAGVIFAKEEAFDLVIYGSSPAALTSAVEAQKHGKRAVIVCPETRIGGLTTGGLGQTDIGNKSAFGGLALQFYKDVADYYKNEANWKYEKRSDYVPDGQCAGSLGEDSMWTFEPSAALKILNGWEKKYGLDIRRGEYLDRSKVEVEVEGGQRRISAIRTLKGDVYRGKMFVDATYEGDLLAAAGVSYIVGREANSVYGETISGVQKAKSVGHQLSPGIDPYVVKGDKTSGLLPGVAPYDPNEKDGDGDKRVQAYCYRLCMTDADANRLPFAKPDAYDRNRYEILARVYAAGWRETFHKFDRVPNLKTDTNNHGPFSADFIGGGSDEWPEASYARRDEIAAAHKQYQMGLCYFTANDPSVPAEIRTKCAKWGLAKDEFTDNGGWPYHIYVREGRRMLGEYVTSEHDCLHRAADPRQGVARGSIGMGSYHLDSHNVRRYVTPDGWVQNEGDLGVRPKRAYPIDYGSIIPRRAECTNLLVPVAVSATHAAFGSIRMEPVFFILGESAATAAAFAAKDGRAVQDVDVAALRERLLKDGQILSL